jgi:hypothetical protein
MCVGVGVGFCACSLACVYVCWPHAAFKRTDPFQSDSLVPDRAQVKKSREHAKSKRQDHERLCLEREGENQVLLKEVVHLREQVRLATRTAGHTR